MPGGVTRPSSPILYLIAILLPPLAVFLDSECSVDFLINILLTLLGWIPGILHAWYVIYKRDHANATSTNY